MTDQDFLKKATEVGNKMPMPYNFGAVVVKDGQIIAIDHNHVHETNDPSRHAEISAIVTACKKLGSHNIDGATLYASHEPCLMCFCCAAWANIDRVVYAIPASGQNAAMYGFKTQDLSFLSRDLIRPMKIEHIAIDTR
jgi:guanine deaminase